MCARSAHCCARTLQRLDPLPHLRRRSASSSSCGPALPGEWLCLAFQEQLIENQTRRAWRGGRRLADRIQLGFKRGVAKHCRGVAQSLEAARREEARVCKREQPRPQGKQVAGEVAAVHRGDVKRWQWLQGARVVPVVEVALMALQALHRAERAWRCAR
jgi:hypothetical protein